MSKKLNTLYVRVDDVRYDMFAPLPTFATRFKANYLKSIGGVQEGTAPGWYIFDIKRKGLKFEVSLLPCPIPPVF